MSIPLVSVICVSFNHASFIEEAIDSVIDQTYKNVELIIVDDCSTDNTRVQIDHFKEKYPEIKVVFNETNLGNCRSFNIGFRLSKGQFIIDLAADDVLLSDRIATGVEAFENIEDEYGVHFSDAEIIDSDGKLLDHHFKRDSDGKIRKTVPQGYIYPQLLEGYHICSPTMMFKRSLLEDLGGYDESLAYEDFDFWVRSSKKFKYSFTDKVLVKKRLLDSSHSKNQYARNSRILESTCMVCEKAELINENERDRLALVRRIRYELKQAIFSGNMEVAKRFYRILRRQDRNFVIKMMFRILIRIKG